jgi:polyribonucleotide nucleotidyltransferase
MSSARNCIKTPAKEKAKKMTINPFGKDITLVEGEFCGRKISLETGRTAFQAGGSVILRCGDTVLQTVAMVAPDSHPGQDFFPMTVEYEERFYAAGRISGSRYVKREGKPSDDATLTCRLIDRPIRPLFPKGFFNEVQVITTVLSLDPEVKPDTLALIASSTALMLAGAPFNGPVGAVRVVLVDGELKAFPNTSDIKSSDLDLIVAGTSSAVMMIEAGAKQVDEKLMMQAIRLAHTSYQSVIELQEQLLKKCSGSDPEITSVKSAHTSVSSGSDPEQDIQAKVFEFVKDDIRNLTGNQLERHEKTHDLKQKTVEALLPVLGADLDEHAKHVLKDQIKEEFEHLVKEEVRRHVLEDGLRPDGRKSDEIRALSSEISILPRTHGSALFTRGSTQALNVTTLAPLSFSQSLDTMEFEGDKRYFHHYNMPGYASGEIKRLGGTGRREIGHSYLAERALSAVLPDETDFPYAIRTVTEILSSNGSTSMAATCSSTLSLMDAGVPLLAPVSGIAMGLIIGDDKTVVLSDIQGSEDYAGDMDFKVAGTSKGITALQMDIKVQGLDLDVLEMALEQSKAGRAHILAHMLSVLPTHNPELSPYAPRIETIQINPEKIKMVIGKGGEMIQKITAETGTQIDISEDGTVMIASPNKSKIDHAKGWIESLTASPTVGKIYPNSRVVSILDFGVFVEFMPGQEGLVHVSEISEERIEHPGDVLQVGDEVTVLLTAIDDKGRNNLSMRQAQSA